MKDRRWAMITIVITLIVLIGIGSINIFFDPSFHFGGKKEGFSYRLLISDERYANDGILRHFDYDAIVIGTSMMENTKSSEVDTLFGVNSVKVPFEGGSYKEINDRLQTAFRYNDGISLVIRGLDFSKIINEKDSMKYASYPDYLYDEIFLNDVNYFFNKDILLTKTIPNISNTLRNIPSTSFDEYANWNGDVIFGKDVVIQKYQRLPVKKEAQSLTLEEKDIVKSNIEQNVLSIAKENPETEFYLFFTPYSILAFDNYNQNGSLQKQFQAERYVAELMIDVPNIHLFSFWTEYEMIQNLDNYMDIEHYGEWVNSQILLWMRKGEHELSEKTVSTYYSEIESFYLDYDYDLYFLQ